MLNGWKAIAAYVAREERTAMRWSNERGLPVHRAPGGSRGSVYAIPAEIDAWLAAARDPPALIEVAPPEPAPDLRRTRAMPGSVVIALSGVLLCLAFVVAALLHGSAAARFSGNQGSDAAMIDPLARDEYLKATYQWNQRTSGSLEHAITEYAAVIARDPRASPAYVGLANSYLLLREDGAMSDAQAYPKAEAAARAAIAIAPSYAPAHRAAAFIAFWWRHDDEGARQEFAKAITLGPGDALTHHWFATALSGNGEHDAALREIDRARRLDPTSTATVDARGLLTYLAGDHVKGLDILRDVEREQPKFVGVHRELADIALFEDRPADYLQEEEITAQLRDSVVMQDRLDRLRAGGLHPAAIKAAMLREAEAGIREGRLNAWYELARVASVLRRQGQAADALAHACRENEPATNAAAGDLWLSRTLDQTQIRAMCGGLLLD